MKRSMLVLPNGDVKMEVTGEAVGEEVEFSVPVWLEVTGWVLVFATVIIIERLLL
jgi:hypothetical protein